MTRILHKGEHEMIDRNIFYKDKQEIDTFDKVQFVLIDFMTNLASHFERSTSEHRITMSLRSIVQTALPGFAIKTNPFMQHAGKEECKECN